MNPTPPRPRLHCRLVRLWSTSGQSSRHAESCADCRQYFRASAQLESALRRDAVRFAPPAPAGLERGIMRVIRNSSPAPAPSRSRLGWFAGGGVAVAGVVALAVILLQQPLPIKPASVATKAPVVITNVPDESISNQLWNAVVPRAGTLVADNPLQNELDSVYSDARSALDFLALNFLPSSAGVGESRASQLGAKG